MKGIFITPLLKTKKKLKKDVQLGILHTCNENLNTHAQIYSFMNENRSKHKVCELHFERKLLYMNSM